MNWLAAQWPSVLAWVAAVVLVAIYVAVLRGCWRIACSPEYCKLPRWFRVGVCVLWPIASTYGCIGMWLADRRARRKAKR